MQFASQIKDFKLNCEHFESAKLIFIKNKNNALASIKSLKVEYSKLERQKSQIETKRIELAELSNLYNFNLIELSLGNYIFQENKIVKIIIKLNFSRP